MSSKITSSRPVPVRVFFVFSLAWTLLCALALLADPGFAVDSPSEAHVTLLSGAELEPTQRWIVQGHGKESSGDDGVVQKPQPVAPTGARREAVRELEEFFWGQVDGSREDVLVGVLRRHQLASTWIPFAVTPLERVRVASNTNLFQGDVSRHVHRPGAMASAEEIANSHRMTPTQAPTTPSGATSPAFPSPRPRGPHCSSRP